MINVTCIRCGVLNFAEDRDCRVCGVSLMTANAPSQTSRTTDWDDEKNHSIPTLTPIQPFLGVGSVLGPALKLFFKNFWLVTKIVFVIAAPFEIFKALSLQRGVPAEWQFTLGTMGLELVCKMLIAPALIYAFMKVMQTGTTPDVSESFRWGFGKLGKLTLTALLAWALQLLGFLFFVIPGIILSIAFYLIFPIAVLEQHSVVDTLKRSSNLTKGFRWNIFGAAIVMGILLGTISLTIQAVTVFVVGTFQFWPLSAAAAIVVDILDQGSTVLSLVMYLGILRALESGRAQY